MAEQTTLWTNETFTAPYTDDVVAISDEIANNSDLNSVDVTIEYEDIAPDGKDALVGFTVQAVIEEEVASNIWRPIAVQHDVIKGTDEACQQVILVKPGLVLDPGVSEKVWQGNREIVAISRFDRSAPSKMRVKLVEQKLNNGHPGLSSLKVSGWLRKHNS